MVLHAAKYPHCAINGLLLASTKDSSNNIEIVDAMPLFHQNLHLSPMVEIALIQAEAIGAASDLQIAGYYAACELYQDQTIDKAPGVKIADKIAENNPNAAFIIISNADLRSQNKEPALNVWQNKETHWMPTSYTLNQITETLGAVESLIDGGAMKNLHDFDNHLDNIKNDWTNDRLNRDLQQLLAMY